MLTPKEVAELTGLSYRSVLRAIEAGDLKAYRLRGRLRVEHEDYEAWLADNAVRPAQAGAASMQRAQRAATPVRGSLRARHVATLQQLDQDDERNADQ